MVEDSLWFNPRELYNTGRRYRTFAGTEKGSDHLWQLLHAAVPSKNMPTAMALEIGPNVNPVAMDKHLKHVVFADVSEESMRSAKANIGKNPGFSWVYADMHNLPFERTPKPFAVALANEVLTFIQPAERAKAISEAAGVARSVIITDRPVHPVSWNWSNRGARVHKIIRGGSFQLTPKDIDLLEPTENELAENPRGVSLKQTIAALEASGFKAEQVWYHASGQTEFGIPELGQGIKSDYFTILAREKHASRTPKRATRELEARR